MRRTSRSISQLRAAARAGWPGSTPESFKACMAKAVSQTDEKQGCRRSAPRPAEAPASATSRTACPAPSPAAVASLPRLPWLRSPPWLRSTASISSLSSSWIWLRTSGWFSGYPRQRSAKMVLTIGGKMAASPSLSSRRSRIQASARARARRRKGVSRSLSPSFRPLSSSRKQPRQAREERRRRSGRRRHGPQLVDRMLGGDRPHRAQRPDDRQRDDDAPGPRRHLVQVEIEPARQQHHLRRHRRASPPVVLAADRQVDLGEAVASLDAAELQDGPAGALHVRGLGSVAGELEDEVRLDRGAHLGRSARVDRPAACRELLAAPVE